MLRAGWVLAMVLMLLPASAFAQWPTECRGDIARVCRDQAKANDRIVLTCLQTNEPRLSRGCRKLLQSYGHLPNEELAR